MRWGHKKLIICFWFPAWSIFLLSGCITTRSRLLKMLLILQHVCFVSAPHLCQDTVTFNINYCSVFLSCSFVKLSVLDQSKKKKAWSPGQFWQKHKFYFAWPNYMHAKGKADKRGFKLTSSSRGSTTTDDGHAVLNYSRASSPVSSVLFL